MWGCARFLRGVHAKLQGAHACLRECMHSLGHVCAHGCMCVHLHVHSRVPGKKGMHMHAFFPFITGTRMVSTVCNKLHKTTTWCSKWDSKVVKRPCLLTPFLKTHRIASVNTSGDCQGGVPHVDCIPGVDPHVRRWLDGHYGERLIGGPGQRFARQQGPPSASNLSLPASIFATSL